MTEPAHDVVPKVSTASRGEILKRLSQGTLGELADAANMIERRWEQGDRTDYFDLISQLCHTLQGLRTTDQEGKHDLLLVCAKKAFDRKPAAPPEAEAQVKVALLLAADTVHVRKLEGAVWAEWRREVVQAMLRVWSNIEASRDPDFDFNDMPMENLLPPIATGLPSGVGPEAIEDPALRRQHEEAIAENGRKAETYSREFALRRIHSSFLEQVERYAVRVYRREPHDIAELEKLLEDYGIDEEAKARILSGVTSRIR